MPPCYPQAGHGIRHGIGTERRVLWRGRSACGPSALYPRNRALGMVESGCEMARVPRTASEQSATILLPNCLRLNGTGNANTGTGCEKSPIIKGFLVQYATRTDAGERITKPLLYR